ncbi:hypothetical protein DFQ29_001878 [Apophysomyces sp. BC1021]|nr:hypothetical protein DFQ29_001878 [Apophysomyces sp. BC1021]
MTCKRIKPETIINCWKVTGLFGDDSVSQQCTLEPGIEMSALQHIQNISGMENANVYFNPGEEAYFACYDMTEDDLVEEVVTAHSQQDMSEPTIDVDESNVPEIVEQTNQEKPVRVNETLLFLDEEQHYQLKSQLRSYRDELLMMCNRRQTFVSDYFSSKSSQ